MESKRSKNIIEESDIEENKIKAKKRGNALGFWFFKVALKVTGLRGAYGLLYIVCVYYLLFDSTPTKGARAYINRRFPDYGFLKSYFSIYKLFVSQGKQLIDRFASISGAVEFNFDLIGMDEIQKIARADKGMVLLTAHVGNWQIALTTLKKIGKKVFLVMRPEDNEALKKALNISGVDDMIQVISPEQHLGGVVPIMNALKDGHIVSFMGDRPYGFDPIDINFIGVQAGFPYGPYNIAAAADVPIMTLLAPKVAHKHYQVDVSNIIQCKYQGRQNKKEQLRTFVQQYADLLTNFVEKYPYQCFLFHDVWQ